MTGPINLENQYGKAGVARLQAHLQSGQEFRELIQQKLIGEDSQISILYSPENTTDAHFFQWSHADNNRWQAYQQEGPAGQQAAGYLEQMVDQRRTLANNYIRHFNDLALQINQAFYRSGKPAPELDTLLDNAAAGRSPVTNADGSKMEQAEELRAFWQQNLHAITDLQGRFKALQSFPKQLSEWLDQNNINRPVDVDKVVEKYRYAGFNGLAQTSAELVDTSASRLDGGNVTSTGPIGAHATHQQADEYGVYSQINTGRIQSALQDLDIHSGIGLGSVEAQIMMDQENRAAWGQYQQLHRPLADTFDTTFSSPLEPRFTLQDLIDNLRAGRPAGQLHDGTAHPDRQRIEAFAAQHNSTLNAVAEQQKTLESMPQTLTEWFETGNNHHRSQMAVYHKYGVEPWQQNHPLEALYSRFDKARFDQADTFGWGESAMSREEAREHLKAEANALAQDLRRTLNNILGPATQSQRLSLDQIAENFRWGLPLGTLEDGSRHPQADAIEAAFASTEQVEKLASYLKSDWLRNDGTTTTQQPPALNTEDAAAQLLELINQGRAVLNNGIVDTLVISKDTPASSD